MIIFFFVSVSAYRHDVSRFKSTSVEYSYGRYGVFMKEKKNYTMFN